MKWWINREGEPPKGPYNWQELATLSGFYEDTLVSREGDKNWVEAAEDPELESLFESPMEGAKLRSQLRLRSADVQDSEEEFDESSALRSHPVTPSDPKRSNGDHVDSASGESPAVAGEDPPAPEPESTEPEPSEPATSANGDGSYSSDDTTGSEISDGTDRPESLDQTKESPSEQTPSGPEIIDYSALEDSPADPETLPTESEESSPAPESEEAVPDQPEPPDAPEEPSESSAVIIPAQSPEPQSPSDEPSAHFDPSVSIPPRPTSRPENESVENWGGVDDEETEAAPREAPDPQGSPDPSVVPETGATEADESIPADGDQPSASPAARDDAETTGSVPDKNHESAATLEPQAEESPERIPEQTKPADAAGEATSDRDPASDGARDDGTSVPIPGTDPGSVTSREESTSARSSQQQPFAGVLPRSLAFLTDGVLLGLLGFVIGLVNFSYLAELGSAGRMIGFLGALWYFGVGNSWVTWGQTPGKYFFGIRVLGRDGNPISIPQSVLRFSVLGIPFFLFNLKLGGAAYTEFFFLPLRTVLTLSVFGLGGSLIYVFLINGRSRRSLHDYLADSVVVDKDGDESFEYLGYQLPRLHRWVLGSWVAVLLLGTIIMPFYWAQFPTVESMDTIERTLLRSGSYHSVRVHPSPDKYLQLTRAGGPITSVRVDLWFPSSSADMEGELRRVGQRVFENLPTLPPDGTVVIQGHYGFDLGVSRYFTTRTLTLSSSTRNGSTGFDRDDSSPN